MRRLYRRRKGSDTWHFHPGCRWWPAWANNAVYSERAQKPKTGELCNECQAKERRK